MSRGPKLQMITVRWEDTGIDILRMEVSTTSSVQTIHSALANFETLKGKHWDYVFRGKVIPSEHWCAFQASVFESVLLLRPKPILPQIPTYIPPSLNKVKDPVGKLAIAKKTYSKEGKKRLQFKRGDRLIVLKVPEDSQWWWCEHNGIKGYAPSTYLDVVYDDDVTDHTTPSDNSGTPSYSAAGGVCVGYSSSSYQLAPNVVGQLEGILCDALGPAELEQARKSDNKDQALGQSQPLPPPDSLTQQTSTSTLPPPDSLESSTVLPPPEMEKTTELPPPDSEPKMSKAEELRKKAQMFRSKAAGVHQ